MNFIEKIQRKPEHVRLRWAMSLTAFSMILILLIWLISLNAQSQKNSTNKETLTEEQKTIMEEFTQQKKTLKDTTDEMKNTYNETLKNIPSGN